jgi:hypothetical protein
LITHLQSPNDEIEEEGDDGKEVDEVHGLRKED